jgi:copper(I)-binding protein
MFVTTTILAACQSGPPQVSIDGTKAELSPAIVGEAMVTMNITNQGGSDVLKAVKTYIPGAKASFHVMQGERMVNTDMVEVPAKRNLEFKMGGSHIMIEDMPKTMKAGSKFNVTLVFQKSGEKQLPLMLQGASEMPMDHEHHMHM